MYCEKCGRMLVPGANFCDNCGAPVPPETITPVFSGVYANIASISIGFGGQIVVETSPDIHDVTVRIDASESFKANLQAVVDGTELKVTQKPTVIQQGRPGRNINTDGGAFIGGNVIITNGSFVGRDMIVVGRGNVVSIGNIGGTDDDVKIHVVCPVGTNLSIDSNTRIQGNLGDMGRISINSSDKCNLTVQSARIFTADCSDKLSVIIATMNGGNVTLTTSDKCDFAVQSGEIRKFILMASDKVTLDIQAQVTDKAVIDASDNVSGNLRADIVRKDITGKDRLNIIR